MIIIKKVSVIIPVYNQEQLIIRALESIPKTKDIEIIVIDDGSTDNTWQNIIDYMDKNKGNYDLRFYKNNGNHGVAYTVNRGYDLAKGDYIVLLGSDDYFHKNNFKLAMKELDGTDFIFFQTTNNYGTVELNDNNRCGSFKFMRKEFIKNFRNDEFRIAGEDYHLWHKMLKSNPTIKDINLKVKHYNYPRKGSLNWQLNHGEIDLESGLKK